MLLKIRVFCLPICFRACTVFQHWVDVSGSWGGITEKLRHWFKILGALKGIKSHPQVRQSSGGSTSRHQHRSIRASAAAYPSFPKHLRLIFRCSGRKNHSLMWALNIGHFFTIFSDIHFLANAENMQQFCIMPWKQGKNICAKTYDIVGLFYLISI